MSISYTGPLSRSWERMKGMLFRPFHIESWFVIGFSAFLTQLGSHFGSVFNWNTSWPGGRHHGVDVQAEQAMDHAREAVLRVLDNPLVLAGIAVALIGAMVLLLVLAWVSARAEFVFLDNVATRRARFTEPWRRFGRLGRSLFLWRAAFSFTFLVPLAFIVLPFVPVIGGMLREGRFSFTMVAGAIASVSFGALIALVLGWVYWIMGTFVVPLMYRHDENSMQAWARFWPLLTGRFGSFLAFTVFMVVVAIAVGVALAIAGIGTCCIGIVLMVIPYIGSVVLLPITVTARAIGPEFMAQFGPEWVTLPAAPADEDDAPAEPRPVV